MLVPPVPWISTGHGGYLLNAVRLVRLPHEAQMQTDKLQEKTADSKFVSVLDAVNTLGACAWTINKQVLDVIIEIFNRKGDDSLAIPPPASECPPAPKITPLMSAQEKANIRVQRHKLRMKKADMHSLWSQELYRLSIANKFRDEVFWFPHNLDFRGRTYPCPPHFNHLGSDTVRGMLLFAKGKRLGPDGLDWMKIHIVNLTGLKKSFYGNKWWQKSDKPWQTLACCIEIAKAVRSQNPEDYICHFPIHQDGSCNGLQHYAALGRDQEGAQSVNLWPYELPQDVYSDVCELIEKERAKEAAEGLKIAQVLEGFISRKVIKQTVMTTVYGVTRYGAKYQILKQLEFPAVTFRALQNWLTLSAQMIASICHRPVEWVTPLGLPVTQPYHRNQSSTRFGVATSNSLNYFEKPNVMKQKNAFPPNFIHSLDSTHMMLTTIYCLRAGITFVSVHDCFWTHPCDVDIMNKICRQQFVAMHKQPVLEDLSQQFINRYTLALGDEDNLDIRQKDILLSVLSNVPSRGTFDLDKVLESTYFFS
ncbi:DNA-directed RNA polymerase, mitochondrial-like [Pomacea canaliculata]|uniref:DNA-directed RNA polymerase, mitochondrial-like n=1 Tax=Pomacea canaliculata TaxID=400727 RepID=UPI000D7313A4|nr:DNA-directed RNA polymerase, mitochondrial-like [Pomacea canaliculata]